MRPRCAAFGCGRYQPRLLPLRLQSWLWFPSVVREPLLPRRPQRLRPPRRARSADLDRDAPWRGVVYAARSRPSCNSSSPAREVWHVVLDVGRTSGPLLLLLFCAQLYSRVLSMTGFTEAAKSFLLSTGAGPWGILLVMVGIWFVLGCLIDSISIMLLTVP